MLTLSNYGPYKPCNPWHLSAGLVMAIHDRIIEESSEYEQAMKRETNVREKMSNEKE